MPNLCLTIEYDGAPFHGWQTQPGVRTVQSELEKVLTTVLRQEISGITASGRTDSGVHARAQVVNFRVKELPDLHRLAHSVSHLMRGELAVKEARVVPDEFHATRSSIKKQYSYRMVAQQTPLVLDRGRAWQVRSDIDHLAMGQAAQQLVGTHDFRSFQCANCHSRTTLRTLFESEVVRVGNEITYRVVGSGFLKHMVRTLVGTLVGIGEGDNFDIPTILAGRDRRLAGQTAPAWGLYLDWVQYPTELFDREIIGHARSGNRDSYRESGEDPQNGPHIWRSSEWQGKNKS